MNGRCIICPRSPGGGLWPCCLIYMNTGEYLVMPVLMDLFIVMADAASFQGAWQEV